MNYVDIQVARAEARGLFDHLKNAARDALAKAQETVDTALETPSQDFELLSDVSPDQIQLEAKTAVIEGLTPGGKY